MRAHASRAIRGSAALLVAALLAPGCLGDLGILASDEGNHSAGSGGGGGTAGLGDGAAWPDAPLDGVDAGGGGAAGLGGGPPWPDAPFDGADASDAGCDGFDLALKLINPECPGCMRASCCPELAACAADPECTAAVNCITACPATDSSCGDKCLSDHPKALATGGPLADCGAKHCRNACARCGGVGSLISLGSTCDACVASSCCKQGIECGKDPVCFGYAECFLHCPATDKNCQDQCSQKYPGSSPALAGISDCLGKNCGSANCKSCGGLDVTLGLSSTCGACIEQNCCASAADCANDGACVSYAKCLLGCAPTDTACPGACATKYPSGKSTSEALATCLSKVNPPCAC